MWLNLSGSRNETAAHLRVPARMTLIFYAFDEKTWIVRAYGTATATDPGEPGWDALVNQFLKMAGSRQIFEIKRDHIQTFCGAGVLLKFNESQRGPEEMLPFFEEMGPD
ncbi:MAG: pyridoxamine 5'-phosphate oxidase family protein, partial [Rhizobiaceae bacterium]